MGYSFEKICSNIVPVGTYKVQVTDIKFKTSSTGESTNDMQVHYTIVEGPQAKRNLIDTIYEKAFSFRLRPFLTAVGIDTKREFSTAKELYEYGIREAKGKFLLVEVGTRTYNGNVYNQINDFLPLPGSTVSTDDVLKEFGEMPTMEGEKPHLDEITPDDDVVEEPKVDIDDIL